MSMFSENSSRIERKRAKRELEEERKHEKILKKRKKLEEKTDRKLLKEDIKRYRW